MFGLNYPLRASLGRDRNSVLLRKRKFLRDCGHRERINYPFAYRKSKEAISIKITHPTKSLTLI